MISDKSQTVIPEGFAELYRLLSPSGQQFLTDFICVKTVSAGENVLFHGTGKDALITIRSGMLRVYMASVHGREVTILSLRQGELFNIVTADEAREGDVVPQLQASRDTIIAYVKRPVLQTLAAQSPAAADYLFRISVKNAQDILNRVNTCLFFPVAQRIACLLLKLSEEQGSDTLTVTHELIANHLGTTREVVSREIISLRADGLLASRHGKTIILDRPRLQALAKTQ